MTVLVLKTLSDLGCGNSRCNEELHFSVDETFSEEENNPRRSSLSQKFSCQASFFKWRQKIFFSTTCIIFDVEQSVRKRKRFFFLHENEREKNIAGAQRKVFSGFGVGRFLLTLEIF